MIIIACNGTPTKKIIQIFPPMTRICKNMAINPVHKVIDAAIGITILYFLKNATTATNKLETGIGQIKDIHKPFGTFCLITL